MPSGVWVVSVRASFVFFSVHGILVFLTTNLHTVGGYQSPLCGTFPVP